MAPGNDHLGPGAHVPGPPAWEQLPLLGSCPLVPSLSSPSCGCRGHCSSGCPHSSFGGGSQQRPLGGRGLSQGGAG